MPAQAPAAALIALPPPTGHGARGVDLVRRAAHHDHAAAQPVAIGRERRDRGHHARGDRPVTAGMDGLEPPAAGTDGTAS